MTPRSLACSLFVFALALVPAAASAGSAEDEARRLFEEGVAAERAGQASQACAKFRQSLGVVREVGPLSKVKDCDLREGKLVSGEANLRELISRWPQPGPELDALKAELVGVEKRIPHITIKLREGAPRGVGVRLDGAAVDFPIENRAVDPGRHELLVEVPNRPLDRVALELVDGERKTVEVPLPSKEPAKPPPPREKGLGGLGIAGIVLGAVGVGGFVGAGVTGKLALDKHDEFEAARCGATAGPDDASCPALASDGDTLLIANGVAWGVGIAGVAVGATLLIVDLTTQPSDEPLPTASLRLQAGYAELSVPF